MNFVKSIWLAVLSKASYLIGKVNWRSRRVLTADDKLKIAALLKDNYYIILTRHNGHLTSWAIAFAHWALTGKKGHYGHALLNVEDEVATNDDYSFIESVITGVRYSTFDEVFDGQCSSVALIKPRSTTIEEWTAIVDKARKELGKPYDLALDITTDDKVNCVEMVRNSLKGEPDYATDYANFEATIAKYKTLDPQMIYECPDFEVVYEVRHN